MNGTTILKFAASAMVIGTVAIGCTPGGTSHVASISSTAANGDRQAANESSLSAKAVRDGKVDEAVQHAEAAVALAPGDAGYRAQLGQVYLQAGRFASAQTSFSDSLTLAPGNGRVELNLALAEIALGKTSVARDRIATLQGRIPEADRGLALALAGDRAGALPILEAAARAGGADAKARQNLALGYALNGRWAEAQSTAAQDLPPAELFARLQQWALFAQPHASWDQVAQLLHVTPAEDPGQPVALALATTASTTAMAAAQPVETPAAEAPAVVAAVTPIPVPASDPVAAPVAVADAAPAEATPVQAAQPDAPAPAEFAFVQPPVREAPLLRAPTPMRVAAVPPLLRPRAVAAVAPQSANGRFVVQLGAFSSPARVEAAWTRYSRRTGQLANYVPSSAMFRRDAGVVHRLTLSGFDTRSAAVRLCAQIKSRGGDCFVRAAAGEQPIRWASRGNLQVASR